MGKRRKARELAIKVLFSLEFSKIEPEASFDLIYSNFDFSEDVRNFSKELVLGVCFHLEEMDSLIDRTSRNWRLDRIGFIDRAILRLSIYEFLYREDIPYKVSINEAIDLGKKFGSKESGAFINGILDKVYNKISVDCKKSQGSKLR